MLGIVHFPKPEFDRDDGGHRPPLRLQAGGAGDLHWLGGPWAWQWIGLEVNNQMPNALPLRSSL